LEIFDDTFPLRPHQPTGSNFEEEKNTPGDLLIRPARGVGHLLVGGPVIGDALFSLERVEACTRALSAYVMYWRETGQERTLIDVVLVAGALHASGRVVVVAGLGEELFSFVEEARHDGGVGRYRGWGEVRERVQEREIIENRTEAHAFVLCHS
jgi:hypothetical protein